MAAPPKAPRARQFVWQPAPELELHTDLRSPNVLAIHVVRPEPPPKPKLFVPPPKTAPPTAQAPTLAAPPEIQSARNVNGASRLALIQPAKAPPRTFVAPQWYRPLNKPAALPEAPPAVAAAAVSAMAAPVALSGNAPRPVPRTFVQPVQGAKTGPHASPLPEPPALRESAVSMAIVGLNPTATVPAPAPEGARAAQLSAAPQIRNTDGQVHPVDSALLSVPDLLVHSGVPDTKPTLTARASPTSVENLRAALRSTLPATTIAGPHPSAVARLIRSRSAVAWARHLRHCRADAEHHQLLRELPDLVRGAARGIRNGRPVECRRFPGDIVDPKYFPAAMADRVEGKVRLVAVIRKDGRVDSVSLLRHLDDRLDRSAADAMEKWQFDPALRDGQPVDVDAVDRDPIPPGAQGSEMNRQYLIIDADDTLWENNIYFERAFDEFVEYLDHSTLSPRGDPRCAG